MYFKTIAITCAALLTACGTPPNRLALTPLQSDVRLQSRVDSVMVRNVSLPSYAAAEEIAVQTPDGLITTSEDLLWADDPERAVTLHMTRNLNAILSADVGPEPWPFIGLPDVQVDVRIERMLAGANGQFQLSGQYFVGGDGAPFPNSTRSFTIQTPLTGGNLGNIATAQSQALVTLSEEIAQNLGR